MCLGSRQSILSRLKIVSTFESMPGPGSLLGLALVQISRRRREPPLGGGSARDMPLGGKVNIRPVNARVSSTENPWCVRSSGS